MPPIRARLSLFGLLCDSHDLFGAETLSLATPRHERGTEPPFSPSGSDSVATARRRIHELESERANIVAQFNLCMEQNDKLQESVNVIQKAIEDNLVCPICREQMINPNVLQTCGHVFCFDCLRYYLVDVMAKEADGHNHVRRIPRRLRRFDPLTVTSRHLKKLRKFMPHSRYSCPLCRAPFSTYNTPIHVPALQSMVDATARSMQILRPSEVTLPNVATSSDNWDGIFCT